MPDHDSAATPEAASVPPTPPEPIPEETQPMLDVHPPHHAATTWRDFLVHIATIVLGLLIAVGLEQTVEYVHHRREVREVREALSQEREENRKLYNVNTTSFRWQMSQLTNNLRVLTFLQQHPNTPEEKLPGVPEWYFTHDPVVESAWKNSQRTQVLTLMPSKEAEEDAKLYELLDLADKDALNAYEAVSRAGSYIHVDPNPSHMTPAQVATEIDLIKDAMRLNVIWAAHLMNVHQMYPDFSPAPDPQELAVLAGGQRNIEDQKKLSTAQAATNAAIASTRAALLAAMKAAGDFQ
jgi:hypothetical protein